MNAVIFQPIIETKVTNNDYNLFRIGGVKTFAQATTIWKPHQGSGRTLERKGTPHSGAIAPDCDQRH